jgi:hypothetical protein
MKTEIENYLQKHNACREGAAYARTQKSLAEVWDNCPKLEWLFWMLAKQPNKPEKELRLFAVWCARQVQHLMKDKRSLDALDVAERFALGKASVEELRAARGAARGSADAADAADAARGAARGAADAAWYAAWDAADAARGSADAAWYAAWAAGAAGAAALGAARDAQLKQFKKMIENPFN